MSIPPNLAVGHEPTADEFKIITDWLPRTQPDSGLLLTSTGAPIDTTAAAVELAMTKYAFTSPTIVTGRYYCLLYNITYTKTVAGDSFDFHVRTNTPITGTIIGTTGFNPTLGNGGANVTLPFYFMGDASYTSLHLSVTRSGGTGTLSYFGATAGAPLQFRAWAELWDRGDTDNFINVT